MSLPTKPDKIMHTYQTSLSCIKVVRYAYIKILAIFFYFFIILIINYDVLPNCQKCLSIQKKTKKITARQSHSLMSTKENIYRAA